jgi:hypothetical protein
MERSIISAVQLNGITTRLHEIRDRGLNVYS